MRTYHLYLQRPVLLESHLCYEIYEWGILEYVGHALGARELKRKIKEFKRSMPYMCFTKDIKHGRIRVSLCGFLSVITYRVPDPYLLIKDDKGRYRDYTEIVKGIEKKKNYRWTYHPYQNRNFCVMNSQRNSITPEEVREFKDEYGFYTRELQPKLRLDTWELRYLSRQEKSWKCQSKRRKQYKEKIA